MAVLQNIRVKFGLAASIIIALGLLSFIIDPNELVTAINNTSSKNDVGEIAGKSIRYTDFTQDVDKYTRISEIMTGTSTHSEEDQATIRNTAWQALLDKYLFTKNAKAAGINVGEDEMVDLTTGDMVSPIISQSPAFLDENGHFSKDKVAELVQGISSDETGNLQLFWNYIQNTVYTQQFYEKYYSLFNQSNLQAPVMLKRQIAENNVTTNVNFVMIPTGIQHDTTIKVTDQEIRDYYNAHKDFFRQNASRDIEYVVFEVKPSAADIEASRANMLDAYEEFRTAENLKSFISRNSETPYSEYWYKAGELNPINRGIESSVFEKNEALSEVISDNNVFYASRVMATGMVPDSSYVRHILLQGTTAKTVADSLLNVLKTTKESFTNLAAEYSADQNSAADGQLGNIGWMTQNYMIPGFESVITAEVGKPFILNTQYGTHVVEVTRKSAPVLKKQVAILSKSALASKETFNEYYSKANELATLSAGKYENYRNAVDTMGVYSHQMSKITEATSTFGSIDHAKEVTRWAFNNKPGKVSDIITVNNNNFFVVAVTGAHKEGYATIKEASQTISNQLYSEKQSQKLAETIAAQIQGLTDLQAIADTLHTTISNVPSLTFASMSVQGSEPKFVGAASVAPENKVLGPIAGTIGAYVYEVVSRDNGSFFTEDDAKTQRAQFQNYTNQMLLPIMMRDADVKDNRARFF